MPVAVRVGHLAGVAYLRRLSRLLTALSCGNAASGVRPNRRYPEAVRVWSALIWKTTRDLTPEGST